MCFDADEHIAVKTAYAIDQKIIAACADHNRRRGKRVLAALIDSIRRGVPAPPPSALSSSESSVGPQSILQLSSQVYACVVKPSKTIS